jgi:serine phosphatase RsbU (regulator of sigma subunit)
LGKAGVFILVGDVSGKGLEAAGIAARTRFALEAQARESQDPARLMAAANAILIEQLQPERFVTAAACLLPPGGGMAKVCLAGHPAPLHFKRDGGSEVSAPHNPPLGVFDDARYCEHDVLISPGDLLIIYTDGVADSRRGRVEFGVGGIFEAVDSVPGRDPGEIATAVCAASSRFHDSSSPADDQLVLAVRLD